MAIVIAVGYLGRFLCFKFSFSHLHISKQEEKHDFNSIYFLIFYYLIVEVPKMNMYLIFVF